MTELDRSGTDPNHNGHLKYPNNLDQSLDDSPSDKIRKYFIFLQSHRETDRFFTSSGVLSPQSDRGFFHYHRAPFSDHLKNKVGLTLAKTTSLRITVNLDGAPITSRTHTHSSHSQTSRLLTSSLSLGVPVPRATECM
jgi:hypothetical protein